MIDVTSQDHNGVEVVDIEGKLTTGASPDLDKFLNGLVESGKSKILLDFANLDFVTSTGLRIVLATGKKLAKVGGKLAICNPNHTTADVLKMSGFNRMFSVYDSLEDALADF